MFSEKYIFEQTPGILVKFCHPSDLRLWRPCMLLLTKSKGPMSNFHYSGFPKHLQTKSNLHISISQSKLKHKCLPLDTLQKEWKRIPQVSIPLFSLSYCPAIENDTCALWQSCSCFVYHSGLGYILFAERLAKKPANCPQAVLVCTLYTRGRNVCSV